MGYHSPPMTMTTIYEVFRRYLPEYLKATKLRQGEILQSVCETTGLHRKAAIRKFRALQMQSVSGKRRRGRAVYYTPDVTAALKDVWEVGSEVCGELLSGVVGEYVDILKRDGDWKHAPEATAKLLAMSAATIKRRVATFLKARKGKGLSSTKPAVLKELIPIFTGPWEGKGPGFGQVDTVVHCGDSLQGDLIFTVNYTDVATFWVVPRAQWNKGQHATQQSLAAIKDRLPFPLRGVHPDTGSEFINWFLKGWCDQEHIALTRSRPNHKNDNAYVEQKNGHVIRRFLGYTRLDDHTLVPRLNELYDILALYLNHFVPSRKCVEKMRLGAKYRKRYDIPRTPYRRVLLRDDVTQGLKDALMTQHRQLNPLRLKREIDRRLYKIFKQQRDYRDSREIR